MATNKIPAFNPSTALTTQPPANYTGWITYNGGDGSTYGSYLKNGQYVSDVNASVKTDPKTKNWVNVTSGKVVLKASASPTPKPSVTPAATPAATPTPTASSSATPSATSVAAQNQADLNKLFDPKTGSYSYTFDSTTGNSSIRSKGAGNPEVYLILGTKNADGTFTPNAKGKDFNFLPETAAIDAYLKMGNTEGLRSMLRDANYIAKYDYATKDSSALRKGIINFVRDYGAKQLENWSSTGTGFSFASPTSFLSTRASQLASAGFKSDPLMGNSTTPTDYVKHIGDTQATQILDKFFVDNLGRLPNDKELKDYLLKVTTEEDQASKQKVRQTGGTQTVTGDYMQQADYERIAYGVLVPSVTSMNTGDLSKTSGAIGKAINELTAYAGNYALPNYNADIAKKDILAKLAVPGANIATSLDQEKTAINTLAKAYYPNLSNQIDQGVNLNTVSNGLAAHVERTLELPAGSVASNNKYIISALQNKDVNGKTQDGIMNSVDFEKLLRADPSWAKTTGAREEASNYANQILQSFGLVG
jgi:hypothetical protein